MAIDIKQSFWRSVWTGYVFWTLLTSLPALIWFYPLNELEISGYETFVAILFSPVILRYHCLRQSLQSIGGDLFLKILCMIGIFSFRCPTTLLRLTCLTIGNGGAILKFVCDLSSADAGKKKYAFWGYTVGFMGVLCTRIWYRSIMPTFNDNVTNLLVFWLTFLNTLATIVSYEQQSSSLVSPPSIKIKDKKSRQANFILVSLGAGSLFFVIHAIFGEVSTPCRWVNGPHPNQVGPQPIPWGLLIYLALLLGLWLSAINRLVFNPVWSLSAFAAFFVMYTSSGWSGFVGAIFLAVYTMSIWPTYADLIFRRLPIDRVGPSIALAMVIYVVECLYSVWTVAYNFVPGGQYTRESTSYLITAVTIFIGFGLFWHDDGSANMESMHLAFTRNKNAVQVTRGRVWSRLFLLTLFATAGTVWRAKAWNPGSTVVGDRQNFTAMIWTYHFGYDNQGWPSLDRTVKLINDIQADVVGLLETDSSRAYMGNNDLAQWLAENLQMYVDFGPNTRQHTWGSMLLSKFPILHSQHYLLPSPRGELAPAISAVLNVSGIPIAVVVTHFGNDVDDEDRKLQANTIARITSELNAHKTPTVFLGYVTSRPNSRDYSTLLETGRMKDIDSTDTDRFCEYIFYNRLNRLSYARISHGGLSDTEVQVARFKIPPKKYREMEDFVDSYRRLVTDFGKIPEGQRMPAAFGGFYGGHFRGGEHHYHMFTPKYFLQ